MTDNRVVIMLGRCSKQGRPLGIRFERIGTEDSWEATWAFPLKEGMGKREGYDATEITGAISMNEQKWPGCPHCKQSALAQCNCDKLSCWDGDSKTVRCAWCEREITLGGTVTSLRGDGNF